MKGCHRDYLEEGRSQLQDNRSNFSELCPTATRDNTTMEQSTNFRKYHVTNVKEALPSIGVKEGLG